MTRSSIQSLLCASVSLWFVLFAAGCSTQREVFTDRPADEVWIAMKAVAETPDYASGDSDDRWTIRQNNIWINDETKRIEIARELERIYHQPGSTPHQENRAWKFTVRLESTDPPTAAITSRGMGVPAHAWEEADRFFDEVWEVLRTARPPKPIDPLEAAINEPQAADPARTMYDD